MLMALLPLAAFADGEKDISGANFQFTISASTFGYNGVAVTAGGNVLGATLLEEGYDDPVPENCYELVFKADGSDTEIAAPSAVGSYTVFARGIVAKGYTGVTATRSFTITKGTIVAGNFTTTPAKKDGLVYSGAAQELITAGTIDAAFGTLRYKLSTENEWKTTVPKATNAGTYTVQWKVVGSNNYNDYEGADIVANIAKKAVDGTTLKAVVIGVPDAAVTYNGNEQKISGISVKIQKPVGETWTDVVTYSNPVVKYYTEEARTNEAAKVKNVATYYLKVTEPTSGTVNYSFTDATATYEIAQQELMISLGTRTKVYDGVAFATTDTPISYIPGQLAAGDEGATIEGYAFVDSKAGADGAFSKNVGTYYAKANTTNIVITKNAGTAEAEVVTANYSLKAVEKAWTITPRTLTISADAKEIASGVAPSALTDDNDENGELSFVVSQPADENDETGAVAADLATIQGLYAAAYDASKLKENPSEEEVAAGVLNVTSTTLLPQKVTDAIVISFTGEGTEATNATMKNYTITKRKADLTIKGKAFTIQPSIAAVQYGTAITPDYSAYDGDYAAATVDESKLKYEYKRFEDEDVEANWTATKPTDVGKYNVRFKDEENVKYGSGAYLGGEETRLASVFNINKKQIKLTVKAATVKKNDVAATFLAALATADATTPTSYEFANNTSTAYNETLTLTYTLDEAKVKITDGRIISVQTGQTLESAIKADISDADKQKYEVTDWTYGTLTIDETFKTDLAQGTAIANIAEAAANGSAYNVTLTDADFVLKKDQWSTLVLPFAIDPLKFCKEVGTYAVFNELKSAKNGNVKFGLTYNELPANTPFLVKPQKNIDFGKMDDNDTPDDATDDVRAIIFHGVRLTTDNIDADEQTATVTVHDADFIGVYKQTTVDGAEGIFIPQNGKFHALTTGTHDVSFMAAYLNVNSTAPARITVEEADGSTTAISSITADGKLIPAEGWYTINGVKLNAAPTEKGVYIQNGKKVVLK